ncbi:MAG: hypothetical protein II852_11130 [Bacteroidales bacterium]|nr:hypothetical protein [Bacteroidales bacterium]
MNFNTSPATVECCDNGEIGHTTFSISNDVGEILLYGYKKADKDVSLTDFVVKNKNNETIITELCHDINNIVFCKHPGGGYFLAIVYLNKFVGTLCIYRFDDEGTLLTSYRYDNGSYKSFLVMLPCDGDVSLLAYNGRGPDIETYLLTKESVAKVNVTSANLGKFGTSTYLPFYVRQTTDGSKIFASIASELYVINHNPETGDIVVSEKKTTNGLFNMSLSPDDRYILSVIDHKLVGYDLSRDIDLSDYEMFYDFSSEIGEQTSKLWNIQTAIDGKIYIAPAVYGTSKLFVAYGIDSGNFVVNAININCKVMEFSRGNFPQIMRRKKTTQDIPCIQPPPAPRIIPE